MSKWMVKDLINCCKILGHNDAFEGKRTCAWKINASKLRSVVSCEKNTSFLKFLTANNRFLFKKFPRYAF